MKISKSISDMSAVLLIVLWIYAAASKLLDYDAFAESLYKQPLPQWAASPLAWLLPLAELFIAFLLFRQRTRSHGLLLSFLMLLAFTVYVALALTGAYGSIPCSCGGIFSFMGWKGHLIFNSIACLAAYAGWYLTRPGTTISIKNNNQKYYAHKGKEAENPPQSRQYSVTPAAKP